MAVAIVAPQFGQFRSSPKKTQTQVMNSRSKPTRPILLAPIEDNHQQQHHRQANENVMSKRLGASYFAAKRPQMKRPLEGPVCQASSARGASSMADTQSQGSGSSCVGGQHVKALCRLEQENMSRPSESQARQPKLSARPSTLSSASTLGKPKICERNSSTNNNDDDVHSRRLASIVNNLNQRQPQQHHQHQQPHLQQQQLATGGADPPKSKAAAGLSAARLFSSLPLCVALFALSLFSSTTTTLVNGIKLQPEGKEKFYWSGEQFVITCQNNNNIKNVKIRWTGPDGNPITENRKERIHVESNGHRLVVNNTQLVRDDGGYTCAIIEGQRTRESAEFNLKVLKETNFKSTAKQVTLKAGTRGQVDCYVEFDQSVTTASVAWFKNQIPVDLLNDSSIRVLEYDPGRQASSLVFAPVKREHDDEYTCQATAVTPNLSKIIDYKIKVETQFGPIFDMTEQIIWVESIQAINTRLYNSGATLHAGTSSHHHQQQQQQPATVAHKNMYSQGNQRGRGGRLRPASQQELSGEQQASNTATHQASNSEQVVRVELKCTCQANPDANILWFASSNQNFAIMKGSPEQVVEDPQQVRSGHNVTSTLVVAYNLDPNWERRHEKYRCSASNLLATAEKFYTIEQGNPPPAFLVGPNRSYSPETSVFNFTLLGPVSGGGGEQSDSMIGSLANIVPPVDSFRIRAESGPAIGVPTTTLGNSGGALGHPHPSLLANHQSAEMRSINHARRQTDQSVQWAYTLGPEVNLPLNMSVKLGNLPSGVQRLFLEAHNAVGYSPNSTYLGEYNLVSSAFASATLDKLSGQNLLILLAGQLVALASYLMRIPHS